MGYCLNKSELLQLLNSDEDFGQCGELTDLLEGAANWQQSIDGLSYLFGQILLSHSKTKNEPMGLIDRFYSLPDRMFFMIQEHDVKFIEFMLANLPDENNTLEDELIVLQNDYSNHEYSRTLRY